MNSIQEIYIIISAFNPNIHFVLIYKNICHIQYIISDDTAFYTWVKRDKYYEKYTDITQ